MNWLKVAQEASYDEKVEHFYNRTSHHIELVNKYIDEIEKLGLPEIDSNVLEKEKDHDASKFEEPELEPYIELTWNKLKGIEKHDVSIDEATLHHITTNKHHPDYWADEVYLNTEDRDKPADQIVDATKMPLTYVAVMAADWLAMSEELGTDVYTWVSSSINKRWKFTDEQVELIYNILEKIKVNT